MWTRPAAFTPESSILSRHMHALMPRDNLPWRCLGQQRRLRAFWCPQPPVINFVICLALKQLPSHPLPTPYLPRSGPSHVRAKCASPCCCKLCLCISMTEDLGKNLGMPAHLMLLRKHMWIVNVAKRHCWLLFTSLQMPWGTMRMY